MTAVLLFVTAVALPASSSAEEAPPFDAVSTWFEQTDAAIVAAGLPTQATNSRIWATSWLAAARALWHGIRDAPQPPPSDQQAFAAAAVATAVHDTLVGWLPDQAGPLDAALAASFAEIPDGEAAEAGAQAGADAAAAMLAERAGDGLDVADLNMPYTPPPEAPGVWRLTPGATSAVQAGLPQARPFLLGEADQFRPAPPPALGTAAYRASLDEVRRFGSDSSVERTAAQTELALVWAQTSLGGYTSALRALVSDADRSVAWRVALLATFHVVTLDAQISVFDAKYALLHWRPVTAIRSADTDGDPLTAPDPTWTPLITTPGHPEYPGGHSVYAGAAQKVLELLVGHTIPVSFTVSRTLPSGETVSQTYAAGEPWAQLTQHNVDARVWSGVHFRFSDEVGAALGRTVAAYDLARAWTLL